MPNSWESMAIALGLILVFYYVSQKSPDSAKGKPPRNKENRSKPKARARSRGTAVPILSYKLERKKKKASPQGNLNRPASLLLHPYSLEQARLEYFTCASSFQGLYEPLYQASLGKITEPAQVNLLRAWECKIKAIHSPHLELVWRSSIQQTARRTPLSSVNNHLEVWQKHLNDWGLQRSFEVGQIRWSLNGSVLEQRSQENEKSC